MKLLQPVKIGSMELKNRVVMAPLALTGAESDGSYSPNLIRFYAERARGGCGMIITGRQSVDREYSPFAYHMLANAGNATRLSMLVDRCHTYGAKVCVQITPGLGRMLAISPAEAPWSSCDIPSYWYPELPCRPLSVRQIAHLADRVGYSARLAKNAGADAVELHAAGGFLLDQFMSEAYNRRQDNYGGSLENRLRFLYDCIRSIRHYCGDRFPLLVKYSPDHLYDAPGFRRIDEGIAIARRLEEWGVDAIHPEPGCYEVWHKQIPTVYEKPGCQMAAIAAVKQAVKIPVLAQGKLGDPELAEQVLQENKGDLVALGHQLIADPNFVSKLAGGRAEDIRRCIGCNECIYSLRMDRITHCTVNPRLMYEQELELTPLHHRRSMLVLGGGAGGMVAALTAAARDVDVELWEKTDRLGGLMIPAGHYEFKHDIELYMNYLRTQIKKSSVHVIYNKEATPEDVIEYVRRRGIDRVVVATGSRAFNAPIKGVENAVSAEDVIMGRVGVGQRAVVIGGGLVGCECALDLAQHGRQVFVMERQLGALIVEKLDKGATNNRFSLRDHLLEAGVQVLSKASTESIGRDHVCYRDEQGIEHLLKCDTVIMATGYCNHDPYSAALREAGIDFVALGDAVHAGKIIDATRGGFDAVFSMEC